MQDNQKPASKKDTYMVMVITWAILAAIATGLFTMCTHTPAEAKYRDCMRRNMENGDHLSLLDDERDAAYACRGYTN